MTPENLSGGTTEPRSTVGPFHPAALVDDVVACLAPRAHLCGVDLGVVWSGDLPEEVRGDVEHVRLTVTAALEPRIHSPGTVRLTVGWSGDAGLGIALRVEAMGETHDPLPSTQPAERHLRFPVSVDARALPRPGRAVLVADGSTLVHAAVASLTTGRVTEAADGTELRAALASGAFPLAFVDVELLDPPGFSALLHARAGGMRVVAMARLAGGQAPRVEEFDLDGLVEKPLRRDAVRALLTARRVKEKAAADALVPPPLPGPAKPKLADLAALEDAVGHLSHDVRALAAAELLDGWVADTTLRVAAMPYLAGLVSRDGRPSRLHRAAHTLKGNCLLFGLRRLNALSTALAVRTLDATLPADDPTLAELWAHFTGIRPALHAISARLRASVL